MGLCNESPFPDPKHKGKGNQTGRGIEPNHKQLKSFVDRSLMLVTALSPIIGYDKASKIARYALDHDITLRQAALQLEFISEEEFDRIVDPKKMICPYTPR